MVLRVHDAFNAVKVIVFYKHQIKTIIIET